jgi:hypothetical protein
MCLSSNNLVTERPKIKGVTSCAREASQLLTMVADEAVEVLNVSRPAQ